MGLLTSQTLGLRPGGFSALYWAHHHSPRHGCLLCAYLSLGSASLCWWGAVLAGVVDAMWIVVMHSVHPHATPQLQHAFPHDNV